MTSNIGGPDVGDPATLTVGYLPVMTKPCNGATRIFGGDWGSKLFPLRRFGMWKPSWKNKDNVLL